MSAALVVADVLVLLGVTVLTLAVVGVMRLPDTFARIHSASKAAALGVMILLLASVTSGQPDMIVRALVVVVFLAITAPVGSHAVARLERACREGELREARFGALTAQTQKSPRGAAGSSDTPRRTRASGRTPPSRGDARDHTRRS